MKKDNQVNGIFLHFILYNINKRLQDYDGLRPFLLQRLGAFYDAEILNIGCGNSGKKLH